MGLLDLEYVCLRIVARNLILFSFLANTLDYNIHTNDYLRKYMIMMMLKFFKVFPKIKITWMKMMKLRMRTMKVKLIMLFQINGD